MPQAKKDEPYGSRFIYLKAPGEWIFLHKYVCFNLVHTKEQLKKQLKYFSLPFVDLNQLLTNNQQS